MKTPMVLNEETLANLSANIGPDGVAEVLHMHVRESASDVTALERASALGDVQESMRLAHKIKGGSGAAGADIMLLLASAIESLARVGELELFRPIVPKLSRATHEMRGEVFRYLDSPRSRMIHRPRPSSFLTYSGR